MLDNAEAPWMESQPVAGQKRPRPDDPSRGDYSPDIVPSTSQSIPGGLAASASPFSTSPDKQERMVKRVKAVPERTVLPKFQKKPNSANSRGSAAQSQSSLPPKSSTGAPQPAPLRNVLGVSARLNHTAELSGASQSSVSSVSRFQSQNVVPQPTEASVASSGEVTKARQELKGEFYPSRNNVKAV